MDEAKIKKKIKFSCANIKKKGCSGYFCNRTKLETLLPVGSEVFVRSTIFFLEATIFNRFN